MFWYTTGVVSSRSALASPGGWTASTLWRILSVRVREHEKSKSRKKYYIAWREHEKRLLSKKGVDSLLEVSYQCEAVKLCNVLKRIIDVFLSMGERGLEFIESSRRIADPNNCNFPGLIELLSRWDPILQEHAQNEKKVSAFKFILSQVSQNEFISACSSLVEQYILLERKILEYFAVIVDAIPDSSHVEQTKFLWMYLNLKDDRYEVQEPFLMFADCSSNGGRRDCSINNRCLRRARHSSERL